MRLFIALPLSDQVKDALEKVIFVLKGNGGKVKWMNPKNIHLTLKFLGDTDEKLVSDISAAIEKVSRQYDSVNGFINKVGAFPNPNRPRVVWAGMAEDMKTLAEMASNIDNEMAQFGFEKEARPFKSHFTLGRIKDSRNLEGLPEAIKGYQMVPEKFVFDRIVLFKSTLTPQGPIYDRLYEAELKAEQTFS